MPAESAPAPAALPDHGLVIYRASRLEALLDPLDALLHALPPADPLAPQTVVAGHPGMRKWLERALAVRRGPRAIVANVDIGLMSGMIDRLADALLGTGLDALRAHSRTRLRWRIFRLLATLDHPELARYLSGDDPLRRRFQLADRIAGLFTQYAVYRADWLADWAAGRDTAAAGTFQPALWRALRRELPSPHRGELLDALTAQLARGTDVAGDPLHVFGLSHLPPAEFALLQALATRRPVVLYVADPCAELWSSLPRRRELVQAAHAHAFAAESEGRFLDAVGHPLLAAWGRMGQHLVLMLDRSDALDDVRHWQDEADTPHAGDRTRLLHRLQQSIRRLQPALLQLDRPADPFADASLRVHRCHTRLRELEVLRDALIAARADDPTLQPHDIVVMAPDINAYVPLLAAVFGEPGRHGGLLPYHLADVPLSRAHPLLQAFTLLLALPASRLTASQLISLLEVPAVARALGVDAADIEQLGHWLGSAGAAWGLDGRFRERFGLPRYEEHSLAWAVDRLLAGYVFGQEPGDGRAVDTGSARLWPVDGVSGPNAAALGALDALLTTIAGFVDAAQEVMPASQWSRRLEALLDALLRIDPRDRGEHEALGLLRPLVRSLAADAVDGADPLLDFSTVRDVLGERLDGVPERQAFLLGGITFCGMVPQRAIPFRMIAVLGLDDGEFPRARRDAGLNLMQRPGAARLGDRDPRAEDRYLFLETVMSARERLHLSWIGEGARDGQPRNPAAPLAELLALLDAQLGADTPPWSDRADAREHAWLVRHPLQPFDARYFDGRDPRLFTFDMQMAGAVAAPAMRSGFLDGLTPAAAPPASVVTLQQLIAWYRDPARVVLRDGLHVSLDALDDDAPADDEPLDAKIPAIERCARRLLIDALVHGEAIPADPPDWLRLSGALPPGRLGDEAWGRERDGALALWHSARSEATPFHAGHVPARAPQAIRLDIDGRRIEGELDDVFAHQGALWLFDAFPGRRESELGFRERCSVFVRWAALRLATAPDIAVRTCLLTAPGGGDGWCSQFERWDTRYRADESHRAALASTLAALAATVVQASRAPPPYLPKTSWCALDDARPRAAAIAWQGGGDAGGTGERDYAPGYARLLFGELEFEPGSEAFAQLKAFAQALHARIHLPLDAELADGE